MHLANQQSIQINGIDMKELYINDVLIWQAQLSRIPAEYQEVEYIERPPSSNGVAYIDLGFAFDTAATIYIGYAKQSSTASPQFFGAAENSGKLRCMITDNANSLIAYGSNGSAYLGTSIAVASPGVLMDIKYILKPSQLQIEDLASNKNSGTLNTNVAFTMTSNLALFAQLYNGTYRGASGFRIYYFKYYYL